MYHFFPVKNIVRINRRIFLPKINLRVFYCYRSSADIACSGVLIWKSGRMIFFLICRFQTVTYMMQKSITFQVTDLIFTNSSGYNHFMFREYIGIYRIIVHGVPFSLDYQQISKLLAFLGSKMETSLFVVSKFITRISYSLQICWYLREKMVRFGNLYPGVIVCVGMLKRSISRVTCFQRQTKAFQYFRGGRVIRILWKNAGSHLKNKNFEALCTDDRN